MLVRLMVFLTAMLSCACNADTTVSDNITPDCLLGKARILAADGFSGAIVCSDKNATTDFRYVGTIETMRGSYEIYDYRYSYKPSDAEVSHGGQRVLIFGGSRYLGQISLSPPPYLSISIDKVLVIFTNQDGESDMVDLSKGPPNVVNIDGENHKFSR